MPSAIDISRVCQKATAVGNGRVSGRGIAHPPRLGVGLQYRFPYRRSLGSPMTARLSRGRRGTRPGAEIPGGRVAERQQSTSYTTASDRGRVGEQPAGPSPRCGEPGADCDYGGRDNGGLDTFGFSSSAVIKAFGWPSPDLRSAAEMVVKYKGLIASIRTEASFGAQSENCSTRPRARPPSSQVGAVVQTVCALVAGAMILSRLGTKSSPDVGWKELLEGFSSSTTNPFWSNTAESPSVGLTWFDSQEIVRSDARSCRIYAKSRVTEFGNALERRLCLEPKRNSRCVADYPAMRLPGECKKMEGAGLMAVACCVSGSTAAEFPTSRRESLAICPITGIDWFGFLFLEFQVRRRGGPVGEPVGEPVRID
ncbi:predicted protein [Chaetomium globosum CBS 148.51]|uniref:Uncharacterized protein n=1 Tax=Chaetomium globosum (strain ATCC 6205 / CBS 148.51 / DSM 1962 / NBRC 6347 / NRRL 1970) TaxID=306901 RepID=Q2H0R6_CHAGB|nr:uncharacterized protein CHGG_04630 [Chaetomium globosum CBS 148.51]EAQ88011.1 predicted protein [Chaetomium globosum CBS 148.51]